MVGSTEVLDALKGIGLNLYERKILLALLAKGVATAAQVSEISGVPRSRSYDVLQSLADKGFVMMQPSKPIKYVSLEPKEALEKTKDVMQRDHEDMLLRVDKMRDSKIAEELSQIYKGGLNMVQPTEMTGTFKGKFAINRELKSVFKSAKKRIDIVTTAGGVEELQKVHLRALKKAAGRGVKVRILTPAAVDAGELAKVADVRQGDAATSRVWSVDGKGVMMALTDDSVHESQDVAFFLNSEHAARSIVDPVFGNWKDKK